MEWQLTIIAAAVLLVAGASRRLTGGSITPAMAFMAIGLLLGPLVVDEVTVDPSSTSVRTLAEATLALVLWGDASRIDLRALRSEYVVPVRLLAVGLPLTIALGALAAAGILSNLTTAEAAVLAIVLAPTDAALGQAVVSDPRLPSRIRQGLNVESGLNDGICVPLLLIALAAADVQDKSFTHHEALRIVAEEIGYGLLGGVVGGLAAGAVLLVGRRRDLIAGPWLQAIPVAGPALAYGFAAALGGSGFVAAFVGGLVFGRLARQEVTDASRLNEELGGLLGGITFMIFGAVLLGPALEHMSWQVVLYALLSLTLIRMLPVAVAMLGTNARRQTVTFLGWFGPRGLASIVFAVIAVQEQHLPGARTLLTATYLTIGLSVFAHGISAAPLARRYADWWAAQSHDRDAGMESLPVHEHRTRGSTRLTQTG